MQKTKMSLHATDDRNERITQILLNVGLGNIITRGRIDDWADGIVTDTGVFQIVNNTTDELITMYLLSPGQAKRFYEKIGQTMPQALWRKVKENRNKYTHLYEI